MTTSVVLPSAQKNLDDNLEFKLIVQNVVSSVNLFTKIDIVKIYQLLIDSEEISVKYNPESFPGLILKIKEPKVSSLIFTSGKLVITGAKSADMVTIAVHKIIGILKEHGTKIDEEPEIQIQNIVASGNLNGKKINLELASMWLDNAMYEPEQFPAIIFKLAQPKTVHLIFQSGNVVCTGAKKEDMVHESVRVVYDMLEEVEAFDFDVELD